MNHLISRMNSLLALATLTVGACASGQQNLVPSASAHGVIGGKNAPGAEHHGVRVLAETGPWPEPAKITDRVTPMRVRIENTGEVPVRVRYRDFALVAESGRVYHAIPPAQASGLVRMPLTTSSRESPGYVYANPGVPVWAGRFAVDYYSDYAYWSRVHLPTPAMREWALPEAVVKARGELEGYLYFPHVAGDVQRVRFDAKLRNAESGEPIAAVSIPFEVKH